MTLFGRSSRQSRGEPRKKAKKSKTWTGTFVCLADKDQQKVPTAEEKTILLKAGLGYKRITIPLDSNSDEMLSILQEEPNFTKLRECGGFEFLKCRQNCRELDEIDFSWTPANFRAHVGSQGKIYLRPIQRNLCTIPIVTLVTDVQKEKCHKCNIMINIRELRDHLDVCCTSRSSSPLFDPEISNSSNSGNSVNSVLTSFAESASSNVVPDDITGLTQDNPIEVIENVVTSGAVTPLVDETGDLDNSELPDLEEPEVHATGSVVSRIIANKTECNILTLVDECIAYLSENRIQDPIAILRYLQGKIVTGRQLETSDLTETLQGETNFILVDRDNIVESGLEEIDHLTDLRLTLEVNFYGETAQDYGGPRKEFFRLLLQGIQKKYFEPIQDIYIDDYETIGKIYALSMLQNGNIPKFEPEIHHELFSSQHPTPVFEKLRRGLDSLGIFQVASRMPIFQHLLRPSTVTLTFRKLTSLLAPQFHETGSNTRKFENLVYAKFLAYVREAASGRRNGVSTSKILLFVTGSDEEPALGFSCQPSIIFCEVSTSFLPSANTCINRLTLPRPSSQVRLPENDFLFELYDYAFSTAFFGLK